MDSRKAEEAVAARRSQLMNPWMHNSIRNGSEWLHEMDSQWIQNGSVNEFIMDSEWNHTWIHNGFMHGFIMGC